MKHIDSDRSLHLAPRSRHVWLAVCVSGVILLALLASTDRAGATALTCNRGGCAPGNRHPALACTITDYRPGYVSGTCDGGLWFANERTARTWKLDTPVTARGCEYENWRLSSAPGYAFRLSR